MHLRTLLLLPLLAQPLWAAEPVPKTVLAAPTPDAPRPGGILLFGDSTTAPRGAVKVYAGLLQEALRESDDAPDVHNAGLPSNTTVDALKRVQADVLAHRPRIVVMQFGINDSTVDVWKKPPATQPRVSLEAYVANYRRLISLVQDSGARVILMTTNPLRWSPRMRELYGRPPYNPEAEDGFEAPFLLRYNEAVRSLAHELGLPLADVHAAYPAFAKRHQTDVAGLLPDGAHPGDLGHRLVAELLLPALLEQLRLPGPDKKV
jgi:lysophospholipase L1-like esterase